MQTNERAMAAWICLVRTGFAQESSGVAAALLYPWYRRLEAH